MRPLIYDFGKLDDQTEDKYTKQMVKDRCGTIEDLANATDVINAVADVLMWSQSYMKRRTVSNLLCIYFITELLTMSI